MSNADLRKELEILRHEFRVVFDAVPSRIWYKDDKNTILRLNKAAAESMGMEVEDVEGKSTYDLFGDAAKSYHEADLRVIQSGEALRGLVEPYTPNDGDPGWVKTDKIPFNDPVANEPRILVVSQDITEQEENAALLRNINNNLDEFASMVSHDLQAPLRQIMIFAEMFEAEFSASLDDDAKVYLTEIRDGTIRMRNMIRSFLNFMRAAPRQNQLVRIDLRESILSAIEELNDLLEDTEGQIRFPNQAIPVRGDAEQLTHVFSNLLQNSIKYHHPDRAPRVDISARREMEQWVITLDDNGLGIETAQLNHIFDFFGRAKSHSHQEGYGLGLAICHRIISMHGGDITVDNKRPEGTRFIIRLNAARA
jgi:PAS domain S-box-containing protein